MCTRVAESQTRAAARLVGRCALINVVLRSQIHVRLHFVGAVPVLPEATEESAQAHRAGSITRPTPATS